VRFVAEGRVGGSEVDVPFSVQGVQFGSPNVAGVLGKSGLELVSGLGVKGGVVCGLVESL
jgi:hypothetical protein